MVVVDAGENCMVLPAHGTSTYLHMVTMHQIKPIKPKNKHQKNVLARWS